MQTEFATISDCQNYISNCIICKKPLYFYIAGIKNKYSFYTEGFLYCKTKIKDCFLISCNKNFPFKINILTNEILKGASCVEDIVSSYLDFYLKCTTCNFRINFQFSENKLHNNLLPKILFSSEELIYILKNKKVFINTSYQMKRGGSNATNSKIEYNDSFFTFVHCGTESIDLPRLNLKKFKNIKKLNNFIETLLIFK